MRRGAVQAVVREAYRLTMAEQDRERRGPGAFAVAWRARLADLLAGDMVEVPGWSKLATAELDTALAWALFEAASSARQETVARAVVEPSRLVSTAGPHVRVFEFAVSSGGEQELGHVKYGTCGRCRTGLLYKISFPSDWQFCGLGSRALGELEARHPDLAWSTTGEYAHARGFYDRYRDGSGSRWTEQRPCPHF